MIATVCKSCYTVSQAIVDRCKWCGSKSIEVKSLPDTAVVKYATNHYVLKKDLRK